MRVDVWVDVACPWCYIGKRRLERAIEALDGEPVEVVWRSYQLAPDAPRFGEPGAGDLAEEYLARKFGVGLAGAREMNARVSALAAAEGLDYRLDRARHTNTLDAHRLIQAAKEAGVADRLVEALFHAQFIDGARLDDHSVLRGLAVDAGMDRDAAARVLAGSEYVGEVVADIREAAVRGAQGVPFFVIENGLGITGAQPTELLAQRMRAVAGADRGSAAAA